jgi:ectoine hydroxylase-related dioxygenase (phytanoyl-CoA dioxygenase family)
LKQRQVKPSFITRLLCTEAGENKSDQSRRAFVINVFADGVKSDSDDVLVTGVPVIGKGEKMQGQFFPLLFEGTELKCVEFPQRAQRIKQKLQEVNQ